jgi:hypothetical protein
MGAFTECAKPWVGLLSRFARGAGRAQATSIPTCGSVQKCSLRDVVRLLPSTDVLLVMPQRKAPPARLVSAALQAGAGAAGRRYGSHPVSGSLCCVYMGCLASL